MQGTCDSLLAHNWHIVGTGILQIFCKFRALRFALPLQTLPWTIPQLYWLLDHSCWPSPYQAFHQVRNSTLEFEFFLTSLTRLQYHDGHWRRTYTTCLYHKIETGNLTALICIDKHLIHVITCDKYVQIVCNYRSTSLDFLYLVTSRFCQAKQQPSVTQRFSTPWQWQTQCLLVNWRSKRSKRSKSTKTAKTTSQTKHWGEVESIYFKALVQTCTKQNTIYTMNIRSLIVCS